MPVESISRSYTLSAIKVSPLQLLLDPNNPRIKFDLDADRDFKPSEIQDPKAFGQLGKLVHRMQSASHQAIKEFAAELIRRVEDEGDLEMTIDQALAELANFEKRINWATAIGKLLARQRDELELNDYSGDGRDLARKDELKNTFGNLRRILGV